MGAYIAHRRRRPRSRRPWRSVDRLRDAALGLADSQFGLPTSPSCPTGGRGYIYLGQQTPAFMRNRSWRHHQHGMSCCRPSSAGSWPTTRPPTSPSTARDTRAVSSTGNSGRPDLLKHFGSIFRNDLCNADVDLGDLRFTKVPRRWRSVTRRRCSAPTRRISCWNGTSTSTRWSPTSYCDAAIWSSSIQQPQVAAPGRIDQAGAIRSSCSLRGTRSMIGAVDWTRG